MQDFLHRLKIHLVGEAGIVVLGLGGLIITLFMFAISSVLGVLSLAVLIIVGLQFMRWIRVQDAYYLDTEGRTRCRKCRKIAYGDGESAHGAAEIASNRGTYLRAYYENRCGNWHLSSEMPR